MGFKVAKRLGSKSNCLTFQFDQIVFTEKEGRCTLRIFASKKNNTKFFSSSLLYS